MAAAPDAFANSGYIHQMNVGTLHMNARTAQEPASAPLPRRAFLAESRLPEKGKFPPSFLLRSDYKVVPFHGRRQELADLAAWCEDGEEIGLRLVTGPGGQGKTRLALEMIGWAEGREWTAGRLRTDCDERTLRELCALPGDALAVVDYAEARPDLLASLLTAAGERPAGRGRLRLLLLARSSGEWWTQTRVTAPDRAAALMYDAEYELPALFGAAEDRPLMFREAVQRFAEAGGYPTEEVEPFEELVEDRFSSALALHMAALAALLDRDESLPASETFRDAAGRVLDHEQRYWSATARAAGLPDHRPRTLRAAMTAVTCCGAADRDEAVRLMECVPDLAGEHRRILGQYADWAHQLHPGEHWLNPLEPDPLAERLVADALAQQPDLTAALGRAAHVPHQQGTLWTVLVRTAARFPAVREAFPEILANGSDGLWLAGAMVASYLPRPDLLQPALTDSVGAVGDPTFLLGAVQTMPHSHRNCDLKIAAAEQALRRYRAAERNIPAEAELHASLADGLVSANRFEEALEPLRVAAGLYRDLARDEPDRYGKAYVRALCNHATQLTNCDHHKEALEVCTQVFAAAERHCDAGDAFMWAQIWWVRSTVLKNQERPEKACKAMARAVEECRTAARSSPAARAHLPITLANLANRLSDVPTRPMSSCGRVDDACRRRTLRTAAAASGAPAAHGRGREHHRRHRHHHRPAQAPCLKGGARRLHATLHRPVRRGPLGAEDGVALRLGITRADVRRAGQQPQDHTGPDARQKPHDCPGHGMTVQILTLPRWGYDKRGRAHLLACGWCRAGREIVGAADSRAQEDGDMRPLLMASGPLTVPTSAPRHWHRVGPFVWSRGSGEVRRARDGGCPRARSVTWGRPAPGHVPVCAAGRSCPATDTAILHRPGSPGLRSRRSRPAVPHSRRRVLPRRS
jgi:tetratricopeptide (TPR) repeat protein